MHRYHLLARLPFQRSAEFQMEAWGLGEGYMDYETTLIWYGPPPLDWPDDEDPSTINLSR